MIQVSTPTMSEIQGPTLSGAPATVAGKFQVSQSVEKTKIEKMKRIESRFDDG